MTSASSLRVASQNVALLGAHRGKPCYDPDDPETRERLSHLAEAMLAEEADVFCLQEVPSEQALGQFTSDYLPGYDHLCFVETNDTNYHHLAFVSRRPLGCTQVHREHAGVQFTRAVASAEVQVGEYPVTVYNVHLRADPYYQSNPTPEKMEAARRHRFEEIESLHQVMGAVPNTRYVVAGDINTAPDSEEARALTDHPDTPLVDALAGRTEWSHPATQRRVDIIALSPELARHADAATVQPPEHPDWFDHGLVAVTLHLEPPLPAGA